MAIRLNTATDYLYRTTNIPLVTSFTMMAWVKFMVDRNEFTTTLALGPTTVNADNGIWVSTDDDGVTLLLWNGDDVTTGPTMVLGRWYHLTLTSAGVGTNLVRVWRSEAGGATISPVITAPGVSGNVSQMMRIGTNTFAAEWFNGSVEAIKIWNVPLNAWEIQQEAQQILPVRWLDLNTFSPCRTKDEARLDYGPLQNIWITQGGLATEDGPPIPWAARMKNQRRFRGIGLGTVSMLLRPRQEWVHGVSEAPPVQQGKITRPYPLGIQAGYPRRQVWV